MGCKHKWAVLDKTVLESGWEQLTAGGGGELFDRPPDDLFVKTVMLVCHCTECGKIQKFTERSR